MYALVQSIGLIGLDGFPVTVETDLSGGLPGVETVGLPDAAVRESKERVRAAIRNAGFTFPAARITINLSPADKRKEGTLYDLPIAVSVLIASGQIERPVPEGCVLFGELSLDGLVRPVSGVLPMVIDAHNRGTNVFFLPADNAEEAACIPGIDVYPVSSLRSIAEHLNGNVLIERAPEHAWSRDDVRYTSDFPT